MSALTENDIQFAYHAESVALALVGQTRENWAAFSWQVVAGGAEIRVAPFRVNKKGKRVYGRPEKRIVMTDKRILEAAEQFELAGGCARCAGDGKQLLRWSVSEGNTYGPCPRCGGTGKAPSR